MARNAILLFVCCVFAGCDGGGPADAGMPDTGPEPIPSLDHCTFVEVPATARSGGTVTPGALSAGTAEAFLHVPLGASLAAYTARAEGATGQGFVPHELDDRHTYLAQSFAPSVGIETIPRIRAIALSAAGETVIILKIDLATSYQGFVHDVEAELGPEYSGKLIVATSHSHSSFGNYSGHSALAVGFGRWRSSVYRPMIQQMTAVARAAIANLAPAQIGFAYDPSFDPDDLVNRDRRGENDDLAGGSYDDHHLFVVRIDTAEATPRPLALVSVFGIHGTIQGEDNAIISTDSIGGIERVLEESFDSQVLVMHLQGAGGDVSPAGRGAIDCTGYEVCSDFARDETVGIFARDAIRSAYDAAGSAMVSTIEMEMLTRTVALGPDPSTFTIRDGALEYAPFDTRRVADGIVYDAEGTLVSPIDEFNAPYGAALCSVDLPAFLARAQMPGTENSPYSYRGCNRLDQVATLFENVIDVEFEEPPLCETTQTTVSALRLGDWMMATMPGEPVTLLAEHLRTLSPMPPERTMVIGYAQNHGGYLLGPEDWLSGGYEPAIGFWGPLEGEYVAEQAAHVMALAATPERENANELGLARVQSPQWSDDFPRDVLMGTPGTVPGAVPAYLLTRLLRTVPSIQPAASVPRMGTVFFTWIGEDPMDGTPRVFLQYEVSANVWQDVVRRSGRPVSDGDLILTWTPDPIEPIEGTPRTHYYTVEFQAAAPMGMPGLEALGDRAGLPLGNYRFRIAGTGYDLTSTTFAVTPAELTVTSEVSGADLRVTVGVHSPQGYRLLDLDTISTGVVPLRNATLSVEAGMGPALDLATDANGVVVVPNGASETTITITDRFDNTVTITR